MAMDVNRLSAGIIALWTADPNSGFSNPLSEAQTASIKAMTDAIARAVVYEMQSRSTVPGHEGEDLTPPDGAKTQIGGEKLV